MNEDSHLTGLDFGKNLMHEIRHVRNKLEVKKMNAKSSNCVLRGGSYANFIKKIWTTPVNFAPSRRDVSVPMKKRKNKKRKGIQAYIVLVLW